MKTWQAEDGWYAEAYGRTYGPARTEHDLLDFIIQASLEQSRLNYERAQAEAAAA
ncbi:MAG: hypothetical protein AB1713_00865 [Pseudomonadota bacterium]